jgi:hypothetical protein
VANHAPCAPDDLTAIEARLGLVAAVLQLPDSEIEGALDDLEAGRGLVAFARRHNQSVSFLLFGDVTDMIAKLDGKR